MMAEANSVVISSRPKAARRLTGALLVGRLLLGVIFVYAAYTKLRVPWMLFAMSINSYGILPSAAVNFFARTLPWIELALGILLIIGWQLRWVAAASAALLVVFFSAMVRAQSHGLAINCGCFGIGEKLGPATLVRDGLLLALAIGVAAGSFFAHHIRRPAA